MSEMKRRSFLSNMGGLSAAVLAQSTVSNASESGSGEMPMRTLGRTGEKVSILGFGSAVMGHAYIGKEKAIPLIHEVLDQGINYFDTARIYDASEEYLGEVIPKRRDEIFLVEKVLTDDYKKAEESFTKSLKLLKVDHVDLLHVHNIGVHPSIEKVMGSGGSYEFVMKMKEKGLTRYTGCTGHTGRAKFPIAMDTGELDVIMTNLNFVDKHTYDFQDTVLPLARRHNMGIVAMKVFGGRKQENFEGWAGYKTQGPSNMPDELIHDAFRYALSIEGVASAVIGMYTPEEVRQNAAWARSFKPLSAEETARLERLGLEMSKTWGAHFGPV